MQKYLELFTEQFYNITFIKITYFKVIKILFF